MRIRAVVPEAAPGFEVGDEAGRARLEELYRPAPGTRVRVNMIASLNGSSVGSDGTSESLTNRVDRAVLGVIRAQADVVVVGAASVRAEGYVVPRRAPLAIVSASGDLSGHRLELRPGSPVLLLVPQARAHALAATADGIEVVPVPSEGDRIAVPAILAALAERGLRTVVCEGGPSLTAQFVASGVVDEICLTTAPLVFLPGLPVMAGGEPASQPFDLSALLIDDAGFSYARWRRRPEVGSATR